MNQIVLELAASRAGVCTRADLIERGLSPSAVDRRIKAGMLRSYCRGVYVVEGLANRSTRYHAATVALPGAAVSHLSAARLHDFPVVPDDG